MDAFTGRTRAARLAALLALGLAPVAAADAVYKCVGADGHVAYQDRACAAAERQTRVELPPAPAFAPAEAPARRDAAVRPAKRGSAASRPRRRGAPGGMAGGDPVSYECRADNGEVFYRHGACPRTIATAGAASRHGARAGEARTAAVTAVPLPRGEACRRIAAAGSIGRAGRARDERVSTYERNAGRDPCRRF